ncbi:MAG TPA: VOC family protein [Solirubrobacteraceae bacterium]|nr:VOC family protein [Solirubrobacteraceae bacterium]
MKLDGMHHITMITGDAPANVAFYADLLGLRMVKKTVNFDAPEAYHLYFGDERGTPGSILTWFEFAGTRPGRAGAGMIHTIELGVADEEALDFWAQRLAAADTPTERSGGALGFADPDGLRLALVVAGTDPRPNPPLRADHPEVPVEHAILGVEGVRAYAGRPLEADRELLTEALGFTELQPGDYRLDGPTRHLRYRYEPSEERGIPGAGTVHHIAWHSRDEDHEAWRERAVAAGMNVTPIIDRDYFRSIYFREPQGVLFEIATSSPGFTRDEDPDHLGEELRLPRQHEHLRPQLERTLTPLVNPRTRTREAAR